VGRPQFLPEFAGRFASRWQELIGPDCCKRIIAVAGAASACAETAIPQTTHLRP
jgi:hypothetical protein